jgi:hypothetical protein
LWVFLKMQGLPEHFSELLLVWAAKRRTRVLLKGTQLFKPYYLYEGVHKMIVSAPDCC